MGKVIGIATRTKSRASMDTHTHASIRFESGVGNDSRGKKRNHRQVTVVSNESWIEACAEMNTDMPWTTRRANILIEGINLQSTTGKHLKIGNFLLEITGELEPCNRMDEQFEGLTQVLTKDWRGGVTCKLLSEGEVHLGDEVEID